MATLYVPDKAKKRKLAEEAALNAPSGVGEGERVNIIAQLEDAEGNPTGPELDLPHDADPKQLEELLNALLQNEDKVPFAFYAAENEVIGQLGEHLRARAAFRGAGAPHRVSASGAVSRPTRDAVLLRHPRPRRGGPLRRLLPRRQAPRQRERRHHRSPVEPRDGDPQVHLQGPLQLGPLHRVVARREGRGLWRHG